jgi:hypothetical protein
VSPDVPKFIIDKVIPPIGNYPNTHLIEKPATDGIKILNAMLKKNTG